MTTLLTRVASSFKFLHRWILIMGLMMMASLALAQQNVKSGETQQIGQARVLVHNGVGFYWHHYKPMRIDTPQFVSGLNPTAMAQLNKNLALHFQQQKENTQQCFESARDRAREQGEPDPELSDYETMTKLKFVGPYFISISFWASGYCGGAYDEPSLWSKTYNARTGEEMQLIEFLKPGVDLYDTMMSLYPMNISAGEPDRDCDYSGRDTWPDWSGFSLSHQGVVVEPNLPNALMACGGPEWAVIPWETIVYPSVLQKVQQSAVPDHISTRPSQ